MYAQREESDKNVLAGLPRDDRGYLDSDQTAGEKVDGRFMYAMHEKGSELRDTQREYIDYAGCDEIVPTTLARVGKEFVTAEDRQDVPGRHAKVTVEEEEQDEQQAHDKMSCLEEFIIPVPNQSAQESRLAREQKTLPYRWQRHERQVRLGDQSRNTRPVRDACLPLADHIALVDMVDDEGECVDESKHEHGVACPLMEDLKLLMRHSGQRRDQVCLCAQRPGRSAPAQYPLGQDIYPQDKREYRQSHPAGSGGNRRTIPVRLWLDLRPVIWLGA